MKIPKINSKWIIGILLALFIGVSLYYRVVLPYARVFSGDWIKFTSNDAYYHMRLIDNLVHNFPHLTSFDPYFVYPGGQTLGGVMFFDWLAAAIVWIIGLGSPTQHLVDVIAAYYPAVLAALTIIPVYFIGKALFNKWAGVLAAALIAVLPGEFMGRSILGFTDHHAAETLFSTMAVLFFILAVKEAVQRKLTYIKMMQRSRESVRPLVYSALAGFFLGIYLITWQGALLFVFIAVLYLVIQFMADHLRGKSTDLLGVIGFVMFLIAAIIFLPLSPVRYASVALVIAMIIPPAMSFVSVLMSKKMKVYYYPLVLIAAAIIFIFIYRAVQPGVFQAMLTQFSLFAPTGSTATTTLEMEPFLYPQGSFSTAVAWGNFTTSFFLVPTVPIPGFGIAALVLLIWAFFKRRSQEGWLFFLIWTVVITMATLGQRRFAYYLVVNVALLSAYISWEALWAVGLRQLAAMKAAREKVKAEQPKKKVKVYREFTIYHFNIILAILVIFISVYLFNIVKSVSVAGSAQFAPSNAWEASLDWMRANTPEPLGDAGTYYKLYDTPAPGKSFNYPASAYGVTSWWDYGYWVSRTARRLPSVNPSQDPLAIGKVAKLFLSQNETAAKAVSNELGSKYIINDYEMTTNKFWAVVTWAGLPQETFTGVYYFPQNGKLMPVQLLYPEYYRATLVRLLNFDGKAVSGTEAKPTVITFADKIDTPTKQHYRQITDFKADFTSYQEAVDYVNAQGVSTHRLIGTNPYVSPVPLEAMQSYKLVHSSAESISNTDAGTIPQVKIFEYTK